MTPRPPIVRALPLAALLTLTACGSQDSAGTSSAAEDGAAGLTVMASFYPLQYVAERVGGESVDVESLTPPGAEPHDLELSPADVSELEQADAVVYLSGFQPAVDEAVEQAAQGHVVDAAAHAGPAGIPAGEDHAEEPNAEDEHDHAEDVPSADEHAGATDDGHGHSGERHAEDSHPEDEHAGAAEDGHGHGAEDPHFWLDPQRLAETAHTVAHELGEIDPDNAEVYEANADALADELHALDEEFTEGLATCEARTIVVSHEAYGYLAEKYDLEQVGISGVEPDAEPSPARLAEIEQVVQREDVTTIFTETLVNPKVAETLASDLNVETAVLDPIEGQTDEDADYQQMMRDNLQALRDALRCQ